MAKLISCEQYTSLRMALNAFVEILSEAQTMEWLLF